MVTEHNGNLSSHHNAALPTPVNCDQLRELIPAYSIGATDPDETALVEAMLPYCPEAAAELADYLTLNDELLYVVPLDGIHAAQSLADDVSMPYLPPVIAVSDKAIRPQTAPHSQAHVNPATAENRPASASASKTAKPTALPNAPASQQDKHTVKPTAPQRRSETPAKPTPDRNRILRLRRSSWVRAAVAAAAIAILAMTNAYWLSRTRTLEQTQQQLAQALREEQLANAPLDQGLVYHRDLLPNKETTVPDSAHATMIWNSAREVGSIYVTGLPPLSTDKVYQLWIVRSDDGRAVSLGKFRVDGNGTGTLVFEAPERIESFQHVGISTEPAQGSPKPTTPHLVIGNI